MGIMKKIWENAPLVSLAKYTQRSFRDEEERKKSALTKNFKFLGHLAYGTIASVGLMLYTIIGLETNEWNPLKQKSAHVQLTQENNRRQERYDSLWNRLFSMNGLADKDRNGIISYDEQFDAWRKMGLVDLNKVYFESNGHSYNFPAPTAQDLERAVEKYETERRN